jgi:CDP-diacylglycerol--serine O-phosphatidyltransferase
VIVLGLLKVSTIRYRSFKDFDLRNRVPFVTVLIVVFVTVFALILFNTSIVFLIISFAYAISGPITTIWYLSVQRRKRKIKMVSQKKSKDDDEFSNRSGS